MARVNDVLCGTPIIIQKLDVSGVFQIHAVISLAKVMTYGSGRNAISRDVIRDRVRITCE